MLWLNSGLEWSHLNAWRWFYFFKIFLINSLSPKMFHLHHIAFQRLTRSEDCLELALRLCLISIIEFKRLILWNLVYLGKLTDAVCSYELRMKSIYIWFAHFVIFKSWWIASRSIKQFPNMISSVFEWHSLSGVEPLLSLQH